MKRFAVRTAGGLAVMAALMVVLFLVVDFIGLDEDITQLVRTLR